MNIMRLLKKDNLLFIKHLFFLFVVCSSLNMTASISFNDVFVSLQADQLMITGKVVDANGMPMPGVNILEKNVANGAVTNFDGNFEIKVNSEKAVLVFSFIGFVTKEISVSNQKTINVTLEEDVNKLDEIVLIGYGEVKRNDLTGSVSTLKPKEDAIAQAQNIESLLQGKISGVLVQSNGFEPSSPSSIKIRGINSLTSNTEPLYVVDGIIMDSATEDVANPLASGNNYLAPQSGGIAGINPRDIESLEVLKDASATAIYGSRGANGVILITTKKGKEGNATINYSVTTRMGSITNNIEMLSTPDYVDFQNEKNANIGFLPAFYQYGDGSYAYFVESEEFMEENSANFDRLTPINWSEDIYRSSLSTNHRLSASGGTKTTKYYFSTGFFKNEGLIPNAYAKKIDFNANLSFDLNDRLDLKTKFAVENTKNSASRGTENLGAVNASLVRLTVSGVPFLNAATNNLSGDPEETLDGPRAWLKDYDDLSTDTRFLGSSILSYKISNVFTYRLLFGFDYRVKERQIWYGTGIYRGEQANGEAGISRLSRFRNNIDNTLMFTKRFNENHRINGTVGVIIDNRSLQRTSSQAADFANKDLRADGISFGQVYQPLQLNKEEESIISFLGRVNYTFKNRYLFTGTFRSDGSSKFSEGNRFAYFPAFAFAWKLKEEPFINKLKSVSDLKLRMSWGLTGNQNIPNYRTLVPFGTTPGPYTNGNGDGVTAVIPTNLANDGLKWETTQQYDFGLDMGFFDDRLTATIDVYHKEISDLLLNVEIGPSTGFNSYYANQGNLENKGIEFSINADIIKTNNFKWNFYGNIASNKSKITKLGIEPSVFGTETYSAFLGNEVSGGTYFRVPANIFIEGQTPGLFYGYKTNGIISNDEDLANAPSLRGVASELGDVFLVDQDGDNDITDTDLTIIGDPNPDFNYGFGSSFTYKNISLSMFFNGIQGNDIANGNLILEAHPSSTALNIRQETFENAWSLDNPNGTYPKLGYNKAKDSGFTDRIVEDGSFLRLSYITLGYDMPLVKDSFFKSAYFSISGQNLLLFTKYSGFDPEVNSFSWDPARVGIDYNSFPNQKSFSMSLNVTF
ncbi:TonB-linked outer membrane protein, SusC/RagA family [Flaviramulus basaltis]|uniref:TonB-linked outer membrane protein, SusC/RagA family n=1 Tax=Flaviramulus basaltis TaxID=369401 RepID=A0A1K2IN04_9FLAO|nr:TonB-dependent receptor [Flaviramulus basaltis]SFZ93584.1 TonB-linked outer membrane protein, SusC/RagA family [Flaviramulus basaltis]